MHRAQGYGAMAACLSAVALAAGCGPGANGGTGGAGSVTYYKNVLPLVVEHCAGCHTPGGLAPFSLVSHDSAQVYAGLMAAATGAGSMPPWPPAAGCGDFRGARRLSSDQIAVFEAWRDAGAPAGDPADAPADLTPPATMLGSPDVTLDPGVDYHPNQAVTDDYHCFLVDPNLTVARDLVGFDIHPGAATSVHHVVLFAVSPALLPDAEAKDAAEPGAGWTCFGGSGVGSPPNVPMVVGGWVPGSGGSAFPPPTGINLVAGTRVIIQVHYNLLTQRDVLDRTTVDLYYADAPVAKPARIRPVANTSFAIAPGVASETVSAELQIADSWSLWGVVPHMHLHGRGIKVSILHPDGGLTCAVDIPRWNFHWQQFYYYVNPLPVRPGDAIRLECTFDNSPESQPIINGVRPPPEPLTWGEATTDEMCLNYLYFTPP
jgi:hypothetical protein